MTPQVDDVLGALADHRRREVVRYLSNNPAGDTPVQEVADHLASRRDDPTEDVMIHLRHAILPLLAERDLLKYDSECGVIQYRPDPLTEEVLAAVTETRERRQVWTGRSSDRDVSP
jgi:hypothetical protein